jgi:hypothetical protein
LAWAKGGWGSYERIEGRLDARGAGLSALQFTELFVIVIAEMEIKRQSNEQSGVVGKAFTTPGSGGSREQWVMKQERWSGVPGTVEAGILAGRDEFHAPHHSMSWLLGSKCASETISMEFIIKAFQQMLSNTDKPRPKYPMLRRQVQPAYH